jgi:hypothetical protein
MTEPRHLLEWEKVPGFRQPKTSALHRVPFSAELVTSPMMTRASLAMLWFPALVTIARRHPGSTSGPPAWFLLRVPPWQWSRALLLPAAASTAVDSAAVLVAGQWPWEPVITAVVIGGSAGAGRWRPGDHRCHYGRRRRGAHRPVMPRTPSVCSQRRAGASVEVLLASEGAVTRTRRWACRRACSTASVCASQARR